MNLAESDHIPADFGNPYMDTKSTPIFKQHTDRNQPSDRDT